MRRHIRRLEAQQILNSTKSKLHPVAVTIRAIVHIATKQRTTLPIRLNGKSNLSSEPSAAPTALFLPETIYPVSESEDARKDHRTHSVFLD